MATQIYGAAMGVYKAKSEIDSTGLPVFGPGELGNDDPAIHPALRSTRLTSKTRQKPVKPTKSSVTISVTPEASSTLPVDAIPLSEDEDFDDGSMTPRGFLGLLPSWLVSMIVHLTLLIGLAIVTMTSSVEQKLVVVEIAERDELADSTVMEITLEEETFDEQIELESDEVFGPLSDFEPKLAVEMLEVLPDENLLSAEAIPSGTTEIVSAKPATNPDENAKEKQGAKFLWRRSLWKSVRVCHRLFGQYGEHGRALSWGAASMGSSQSGVDERDSRPGSNAGILDLFVQQ